MSNKYKNHQSDFNNAIQLDSEFDQHLANMKKHILLLSDKKSKQYCALWIKKLCEISDSPNIITKQIRNSYSYNLLKNLENTEQLVHPFNEKPPSGSLKYLTAPPNSYPDQRPDTNNSTQNTSSQVHDVKRLNLESGTSTSSNESTNYVKSSTNDRKSIFDERDYNSSYSDAEDQADQTNNLTTSQKMMNFMQNKNEQKSLHRSVNYPNNSKRDNNNSYAPIKTEYAQVIDTNDLQLFVNNLNQQNENQKNSLEKQKNFQIHQLEFQIKKQESKFQEEKLDFQHQHNLEIQKIMDRKNQELEKVKKEHRSKAKDDEDLINNLERKLNQLAKQFSTTQVECDRKINDLTNETSNLLEKNQKESEKKFKDLFYKAEKEKADLQQQHTQAFQVLVEETNHRLKKVESEYNDQQTITDKVVKELENRTQLLKNEMENNLRVIDELEEDKRSAAAAYEALEAEFEDFKKKSQSNLAKIKEAQSMEIATLESKMDANINEVKFEFQKKIEKEIQVNEEMEKNKILLEKKHQKLVNLLREKDFMIENLKNGIKKQEIQAEDALNEIREQVEQNSKKIYEEMEEQMTKCEVDLARSKSIRDKQNKESQKQLDRLKNHHEKEIQKLKNEYIEKEKLTKIDFEEEKRNLTRQNSEALTNIQEKSLDNNLKYQTRIEDLTSTVCNQDTKITDLQRELTEANSLRKTQIIELGILREDEKIKLIREKDLEIERLKVDMESNSKSLREDMSRLKETQKEEIKNLLFTANQEKKNVVELAGALEENLKNSKLENQRIIQVNEQNIKEVFHRLEEEKNHAKKPYQNRIAKLEREIEFVKKTKDNVEFQLNMANSDYEHQLTKLKMHYEDKQKGLLSQDIRHEFEETINSLKAQVQILQQRSHLLQSELDDRNHLINSSSCTASL